MRSTATPHLAIISHLSRLPSQFDTATELACSLTLSSGWVGSGSLPDGDWKDYLADFFLPWRWLYQENQSWTATIRPIPQVQLWFRQDSNSAWAKLNSTSVWPLGTSDLLPDIPGDRDRLARFDANQWQGHWEELFNTGLYKGAKPGFKPESLVWELPNPHASITEEARFSLPSQLARLATSLAPLNHTLGLACCLKINLGPLAPAFQAKLKTSKGQLFAAPVFPGKWGNQLDDPQPDPNNPPPETLWSVLYKKAAGPTYNKGAATAKVRGYCNVVQLSAPTPVSKDKHHSKRRGEAEKTNRTRIDLHQLRIRLKYADAEDQDWNNDWLARLETNAAGLFDLSQRFVDCVRQFTANGESLKAGNIWSWILGTSRDLAGLGLLAAPEETKWDKSAFRDILEKALQNLNIPVPQDLTTQLLQAEATATHPPPPPTTWTHRLYSAETWLKWLRDPENPAAAKLGSFHDLPFPSEIAADPAAQHLATWERYLADLREPEICRELILAELHETLRSVFPTMVDSIVDKVRESRDFQNIHNPARLQARGVLARFWPQILKAETLARLPKERIKDHLVEAMMNYCKKRGTMLDSPIQTKPTQDEIFARLLPRRFPELPAGFQHTFKKLVDVHAKSCVQMSEEGMDEKRILETPPGVTLHVDQPDHENNVLQKDDRLSEIAGVIVLMREVDSHGNPLPPNNPKSAWRCLHYGQPVSKPKPTTADPDPPGQPFAGLYVIPSRLGYLNQRRQSSLTYDNHSLVSICPSVDLLKRSAARLTDDKDAQDELDLPFRLAFAIPKPPPFNSRMEPAPAIRAAAPDQWSEARLIGLVYGRQLQFVALPILNAGVLPKELCAESPTSPLHPAVPRLITSVSPGAFPEFEFTVPYLRQVGVGLPRINQPLPKVPASVRPLAWEVLPSYKPFSTNRVPERPEKSPFVMLFPKTDGAEPKDPQTGAILASEWTFKVGKPTTDFENWDRWLAQSGVANKERINERANFAKTAESGSSQILLEDPALADLFWLELEQMFPFAKRSGHAVAATSEFELKASDIKQPIFDGARIEVPMGSVWRLHIHPLVEKDAYCRLFDKELFEPILPIPSQAFQQDPLNGTHRLFPARTLIIEAASNSMPTAQELWDRLRPATNGGTVTLTLDLHADGSVETKFAMISRVEVRHQVWTWNGWQMPDFPFARALHLDPAFRDAWPVDGDEPKTNLLLWDAVGFHDREDWQHAKSEATVVWRRDLTAGPLASLFEQDHSQEQNAVYYRFGTVAHSRYEGVYPNSAVLAKTSPVDETNISNPWRRIALPARPIEALPRPVFHLAIPLTRTFSAVSNSQPSPGLLIVLRERWFAHAGMAEKLEAEFLTHEHVHVPPLPSGAYNPDPKSWETRRYPAGGFDPIISTTALPLVENNKLPIVQSVSNPIGLTFDLGASNPLVNVSTFVLDKLPPEFVTPGNSPDWFFCQFRLRRRHAEDSLRPNKKKTGKGVAADSWTSEWSAPEFVQFLPDANRLLPMSWRESDAPIQVQRTTISETGGRLKAIWTLPDNTRIPPDPAFVAAETAGFFDHWILVTRAVVDIRGQEQEAYECIIGRVDANATPTTPFMQIDPPANPQQPPPAGRYYIRVLEVRIAAEGRGPTTPSACDKFRQELRRLWEAGQTPFSLLFGLQQQERKVGGIRDDVMAQIAAVSDRVQAHVTPAAPKV